MMSGSNNVAGEFLSLQPNGELFMRVNVQAPSALLGLFVPGDSQLFGAPAGRDRTVAYGLCSPCFARPDVLEAVEERVFEAVAGGAA